MGRRKSATAIRDLFSLALLLLLCSASETFAQNKPDQNAADEGSAAHHDRSYLFGDWGGKRSELAKRGIVFDFFYVSDLQANPVGGLQQTQVGWGRIRGTMDIDFGKLTD